MVINALKKNKAEEGVGSAGRRQGRLQLSTSKALEGLSEKGTPDPRLEGALSASGTSLAEWPRRQSATEDHSDSAFTPPFLPIASEV